MIIRLAKDYKHYEILYESQEEAQAVMEYQQQLLVRGFDERAERTEEKMKKTKKTFWYMVKNGVQCVAEKKVDKIGSTTPMVYGKLAEMIYAHCEPDDDKASSGFRFENSKKITVTIES